MGGHNDLILFAPEPLCQLDADGMSYFGGRFTRSKGLVAMVSHSAAFLAEPLLHRHHLLTGSGWTAVDAGHKLVKDRCLFVVRLTGLSAVHGIPDDVAQTAGFTLPDKGRVFGLVGILHIKHHLTQPTFDPPDGCNRHYFTMGAGVTTAAVILRIASSTSFTAAS